ncbi:hypothetical protein D1872_51810 [compost metagenome]
MSGNQFGNQKTYIMYNKSTNARIECTEKYLLKWMSMGFEVESIKLPEGSNPDPTTEAKDGTV